MNIGILQLSIVFLLVGAVLLTLVKKIKNVISANGKKGLFYLLAAIVLFAVTGFFGKESLFSGQLMVNYISIQLIFLLLGIIHLVAMNALLKWEEADENSGQFIFSLIVAIFGSIGFINAIAFFGAPGFYFFFLSGVIAFFIPMLFLYLWKSLVSIPVPVYQRWHYPIAKHVSPPDPDELRNLRILSLEFEKTANAQKTVFKAKAPENMNYGKFFYYFINDYNQRSPEAPIAFKDENNQPYGWHFYVKPNALGLSRNINPELTVASNRIKEHATIICQRVES